MHIKSACGRHAPGVPSPGPRGGFGGPVAAGGRGRDSTRGLGARIARPHLPGPPSRPGGSEGRLPAPRGAPGAVRARIRRPSPQAGAGAGGAPGRRGPGEVGPGGGKAEGWARAGARLSGRRTVRGGGLGSSGGCSGPLRRRRARAEGRRRAGPNGAAAAPARGGRSGRRRPGGRKDRPGRREGSTAPTGAEHPLYPGNRGRAVRTRGCGRTRRPYSGRSRVSAPLVGGATSDSTATVSREE